MNRVIDARPKTELVLARQAQASRARLRIYIGAAPGVGKTYQILEDAHQLKQQGLDIVIGFIEPHGRAETEALIGNIERVPLRRLEYSGATLEEMDVNAVIARKPEIVIVDELAHTNACGSKNGKRYEDVLEILDAGISVVTAVNIQHMESLNESIARITGAEVREAIPDYCLRRADEVVNVDVSVDTLRTRLRQGKIYSVEKIDQALTSVFRKDNLSALRELALRQAAMDQTVRPHTYRRDRDAPTIREIVMVCVSSSGSAERLLRAGSRIAARLGSDWCAVHVATTPEGRGRIDPVAQATLNENIRLAEELGANVVKLKADRVADGLIAFARREGITHVVFGQSARSRWDILLHGSVINRFLSEVRGATVQVVPLGDE
jgi:two-component system sensor histidine kinase KdpD